MNRSSSLFDDDEILIIPVRREGLHLVFIGPCPYCGSGIGMAPGVVMDTGAPLPGNDSREPAG